MSSGKGLAKAAVVIMIATLMGRLVGFLREIIIANQFGASIETDAYVIAYTIPSMVAMAFAGAFNAAFLPVFNDFLVNRNKEDAQRLASTILNLITVLFIVIIAIAFIFGGSIVEVLAPGFDQKGVDLTTDLFRIILPALLFVGLMGLASAILNTYKHFLFPALGPMVTSIIIILFILLFGERWGIYSLVAGTTVGFGAQFILQIPVMFKKGFRYKFSFSLENPGVKRTLILMVPVLIGAVLTQGGIFVERGLASTLDEGSISALNYANRVMQLPLGLFVTAISIPIFPALSVLASKGEYQELKETMTKGISMFFIILVPATVGLIVLNQPIIRLLFEHGEFTADNTAVTAYALSFYAFAVIPWALKDIMTRSFYALQDTVTPVVITGVAVFFHVLFNFILVKIMGVGGLALGTALGLVVNVIVLYIFLRRKLGSMNLQYWLVVFGKTAAAGLLMAAVTLVAYNYLDKALSLDTRNILLVKITISGIMGLVVYFISIALFKVKEIWDMLKLFTKLKTKVLGTQK